MMSEKIISCCPGKVILHGEHAVVYGKNAVAVSVDLTTKAEINVLRNDNYVKLNLCNFNKYTIWSISELEKLRLIEDNTELNKVLNVDEVIIHKLEDKEEWKGLSIDVINSYKAFLLIYVLIGDCYCGSRRQAMEVTISSTLPCGAGLGSSSSYTVSLTAALLRAYKLDESLPLISEWAFQIDKLFHGKPSGIDNSICTFGGALLFHNGSIKQQIPNIKSLPVILVNTKVQRNTKAIIQKVKQKFEPFPKILDNILDAIDQISQSSWHILNNDLDLKCLSVLFEINQHLLNSLGAGHSAIDQIVKCSEKYGLSAKLTGAGCGGTVIILNTITDTNIIDNLYKELDQLGYQYWVVCLGCKGVSFD